MTICNENKHGEIVYDSGYRYCPACERIEKLLSDIKDAEEVKNYLIDENAWPPF